MQCKKRTVYGIAYEVESYLYIVEKLVQAPADDFADLNVVQLSACAAEVLLGRIGEGAEGGALNSVKR